MLKIVPNDADRDDLSATLDELVAEGARRMLIAGLEAEVADYIERHQELVDEAGHRLVVRNGSAAERSLMTGAGALKIRAPRVNDRREGHVYSSYILPKYARRSPKVADVLPVLYLRGLSTGDFVPALAQFFGSDAGLSATSIGRLLETWGDEYTAFTQRDLSTSDFVYLWADGVHFRIRLEEDRLCCLVVIGVRADGSKELLACSDGYRESTESWADVLRDLKSRGMTAPMVAVGDGALGFWSALGDVFPATREQRCWVHKTANILDVLPKRLHRQAKAAIHEIYLAETRADAEAGIDDFVAIYGDKYPKAAAKLVKDRDVLLTFYDFPAAHWVHLRTTNPIESTFATVRARTKVTKGAGSRRRGLVMAYKLLDAAQDRWRKVNSPELVIQVRSGIEFKDGIRVERRTEESRDAA
ncbi:MAG: IS256 family transposase [Actinomycetota bacterium]|nr:IS256 family transposase [Actinomycetota bacterium]